ncbi:3 beta-hydroxysteroid dehydrogenase/Delta 5--_4-isomerase [Gimesia panareensis]|uniref:3 beta-hydroxysteroid dehydrogenase/Delta 5-->4-isomerase n=1 Tax=Gimesia panareensis TaxID=2527978 RepID=A0A518FTC6_9PLAN|nr:NAD(P)-dependent oxidoreductase [Gimesia panareensis]QDV19591.1 3 beta-hydroxysteroid dehydrogenase/Delta 5-->4-isomerase [Gimesia panareensis]
MHGTSADKPVILITGAAGLIGSRLVETFSDQYQVVAFDIKPLPEEQQSADWIACDLTDDASVSRALSEVKAKHGNRIASVIHLAAYYDFSGESSPLYQDLTVAGTRRMLQGLQDFNVEQFIFSSSLLVQQSVENGQAIQASSPVNAEWDYPQSKLEAEATIKQYAGSIPTVILRLAGVYDEDCHSIPIAQQISRIYQKQLESYFFPGDKTCGQAFLHLDDLVSCFAAVVGHRGRLPKRSLFVIGEEDVMSYEELQEKIGLYLHGDQWPAIRIPKTAAKAGAWVKDQLSDDDGAPFIKPWMIDLADQNYPVSVERAREQLGWEPRHLLRETLPDMIDELQDDPEQWYAENGLPVPDDLPQPESTGVRK